MVIPLFRWIKPSSSSVARVPLIPISMAVEAETFRRVTMKVLSMQLNSIIIMDVVAYGGSALGIICAVQAFYAGTLSLDGAFVCILLSADFFIPLRKLCSAFYTAMNGVTASRNIFELLDSEASSFGDKKIPEASENFPLFEAKGLGYEFDRTVLSDCSVSIEKGSFTVMLSEAKHLNQQVDSSLTLRMTRWALIRAEGTYPGALRRKRGMYPTAIPYENERYPDRSAAGFVHCFDNAQQPPVEMTSDSDNAVVSTGSTTADGGSAATTANGGEK